MRLLHTNTLEVSQFNQIPPYAILSHTWGEEGEEVTFEDIRDNVPTTGKPGYSKVKNTCLRAVEDGLDHVWIDSCCINKSSSAELSEALNSMYAWYQEADVCYVYLIDVPHGSDRSVLSKSRWFTRGWTLQELIAPSYVIFLDNEWCEIGTKSDLREIISEITGIPVNVLLGDDPGQASVAQRMFWAANRVTERIEDRAYSLMGIFGVNMPMLYGERERSFIRLQEEIMKVSNDHSIFAWTSPEDNRGPLATSPDAFASSRDIISVDPLNTFDNHALLANQGIQLTVPFMGIGQEAVGLAMLNCARSSRPDSVIAIYLRDISLTMRNFERVRCEELELVQPKRFNPLIYPSRKIYMRSNRSKIKMVSERSEVCVLDLEGMRTNSLHFHPAWELSNGTLRAALPNIDDTGCCRILVSSTDGAWFRILLRRSGGHLSAEVAPIEPQQQDETGDIAQEMASHARISVAIQKQLRRNNIFWRVRIGHTPPVCDPHEGIQFNHIMVLNRGTEDEELSFAVSHGVEEIFKLLIAQDNVRMNCKTSLGSLIARAAEGGHLKLVKLLLEVGAQPESFDIEGRSPIHYAAANGHMDIVSLLLARGVDVNLKDNDLWTPLAHAAERGRDMVVQLLLNHPCISLDTYDKYQRIPLLQAAREGHVAIVKMLLESGSNPNTEDQNGMTPLSFSACNGHNVILREIFKTGKIHVDLASDKGKALLQLAAENGHTSIIKELLGTRILTQDHGAKLLQIAASNGHIAVVKELLDTHKINIHTRYDDENTVLHLAAENGHRDMMKVLLANTAVNADSKNDYRKTPLHIAARNGHIGVIQELLATGRVHADSTDSSGMTALQSVALHGNKWVVWMLLIRTDVDFNRQHMHGLTALWLAAQNGHTEVVRQLLAKPNINPDIPDKLGRTPLWVAASNGHESVVKQLLETGRVDLNSEDKLRRTPFWGAIIEGRPKVVRELLKTGKIDINAMNGSQKTPGWYATLHGMSLVLEELLNTGKMDPDATFSNGQTLLHIAASRGHKEVVEVLVKKAKVDPDRKDKYKHTPLWFAAKSGNMETFRFLLETGRCNPNFQSNAGRTPLQKAVRKDYE